MRVFGIMLIFLVGPVWLSEAADNPGLARFAYAESQAFLNTVAPRVPSVDRPASRPRFERAPAPIRLHVLTVAAAKHLAGYADSLPPVLAAARTDVAPLHATKPGLHPAPPRIAASLNAVSAPPLVAAVAPKVTTTVASGERLASLSALPISDVDPIEMATAGPRPTQLQAATTISAVAEPTFAAAIEPPVKPPASERIASLSDPAMAKPMRLLANAEPKPPANKQVKGRRATVKARAKVKARARIKSAARSKPGPARIAKPPAYAQGPAPATTDGIYRPTMLADDISEERRIPRWAAKMYDSSWQQHAFTYQ